MEKKSRKTALLKDKLDDILAEYDMNITNKGEDILKKLARDERIINLDNLIFKTGDLIIGNCDFVKRFRTLYELFSELIRAISI